MHFREREVGQPLILDALAGVLSRETHTALKRFFHGYAKTFRVALDDTCLRPADWRLQWTSPPTKKTASSDRVARDKKWWGEKYGAQGLIPHMIEASSFATNDWRTADAILVVHFAHHETGLPGITQQQCLQRLRHQSAAFRETEGRRHFFIFTGDNGPCCVCGRYKDVDFLRYHVIGNHGQYGTEHQIPRWGVAPPIPCFDPRKDISIPTPSVHHPLLPFATPLPRAAAAGGMPRPLLLLAVGLNRYSVCRMRLLQLFEHSTDEQVVVRRHLPTNETAALMLNARFCPICSGFSPWTQRLPEALHCE